jgi:DNA repair photolyase
MEDNLSCTEKQQKTVFGTKEWAKYNENIISGCSHDCRYCYAKTMAVRFGRKTVENWKEETIDRKKIEKRFTRRDGRFMFPTTHDITPANLDYCIMFLGNLLKSGNEVLVVSKPHLECIGTICDRLHRYSQQVLFRFTIGSADDQILKFWDQNAPGFDERLEALMYAHMEGFQTSVSCEPMLDDNVEAVIIRVLPYVTDAIWLGTMNQVFMRLKINGHGDKETLSKARQLVASQSNGFIAGLYAKHKDNRQIKWKESIKKEVGIEIPLESGLDI